MFSRRAPILLFSTRPGTSKLAFYPYYILWQVDEKFCMLAPAYCYWVNARTIEQCIFFSGCDLCDQLFSLQRNSFEGSHSFYIFRSSTSLLMLHSAHCLGRLVLLGSTRPGACYNVTALWSGRCWYSTCRQRERIQSLPIITVYDCTLVIRNGPTSRNWSLL